MTHSRNLKCSRGWEYSQFRNEYFSMKWMLFLNWNIALVRYFMRYIPYYICYRRSTTKECFFRRQISILLLSIFNLSTLNAMPGLYFRRNSDQQIVLVVKITQIIIYLVYNLWSNCHFFIFFLPQDTWIVNWNITFMGIKNCYFFTTCIKFKMKGII